MKIYIASSWKNQHAVEMLTRFLREAGHTILSFVENNHGENPGCQSGSKPLPFDEWVHSESGTRSFEFDVGGATKSDLVIYIGPSGTDAWAEVGAAYASKVPIIGLWSKGEQAGIMRRMVHKWFTDYRGVLEFVEYLKAQKLRDPLCSIESLSPFVWFIPVTNREKD